MSAEALLHKLTLTHWLMVSVALVSLAGWMSEWLYRALVLHPHSVARGQLHRLLTAGWLHGDLGHLLFNMLALSFFADQVITVLGEVKFLILYVSAVVVAYIPTTLRYRRVPRYSSLGASGAVAAVMLGGIALHPGQQLRTVLLPYPIPSIALAAAYMLYSVWHSRGTRDNINHDAHFSGAAYGLLLTYLLEPARVGQSLQVLERFVRQLTS